MRNKNQSSVRTAKIRETICPPFFCCLPATCIDQRADSPKPIAQKAVNDSIRLPSSASTRYEVGEGKARAQRGHAPARPALRNQRLPESDSPAPNMIETLDRFRNRGSTELFDAGDEPVGGQRAFPDIRFDGEYRDLGGHQPVQILDEPR